MFTMFRIAAVAGAILLAIVGFGLLSSRQAGRGRTPAPTSTPIAMGVGRPRLRVPGTYATQEFLVPVTFTVPAGWEGHVGGPYIVDLGRSARSAARGDLRSSTRSMQIHVTSTRDPWIRHRGRRWTTSSPALVGLPGLQVSTPTDITIDGYRGKQLTMTAPSDVAGCTLSPDGNLRVWELPLGATYGMVRGQRDRHIILDVEDDGSCITTPDRLTTQSAATNAEIQAVVDSIRITPAPPSASPS